MAYVLFCVGIVAGIVVSFVVHKIVKGRRQERLEGLGPFSSSTDKACSASKPGRQVKRISVEECEDLVHARDNLVFIALRRDGARAILPFFAMRAISITPSQLVDVLKLIPDCSVVMCAEVELYPAILEVLEDFVRATPIYFVESAAVPAEVMETS